ncbi:substrate-binding domain-containing protein [Tessaracoccus aquimaris]|uniref:substrate-binding domain-containing protein n=1 Tax=Tessaracoccus aquimaris TaxID=1332264 RepID=UPI0009898774|nr:substrate-binding domain-containing protein [Tessaracoccus aquimaris]
MVLSGVIDRATELGYDLTIHTDIARKAAPGALRPGSSRWINKVADAGAAGLVVLTLPTSVVDTHTALKRSFPVALIDPIDDVPPEVLSVSATNWQGGRQATQHLLDLGHTRIGVVGGLATSRPAVERIEGYRSALEGAGIAFNQGLVLHENFHYQAGLAGVRYLLGLAKPPTAIFALSDLVALGVIDSCRRRGLRIPQDLSLIGFDDTPLARSYVPALTTIRQPLEAMGSAAVTLLDNARRLPGTDWPRFQLETRLMVRDSTGYAPQ